MKYQNTFRRYEIKYLLTRAQRDAVLSEISSKIQADKYSHSTIRNLYLDTESYRLIRRSMEKPIYKEKLRLRTYGLATPESQIFVELKKKFQSVVYKRRLILPEGEIMEALCNGTPFPVSSQIGEEIQYFREYYGDPIPRVFLSYERDAYCGIEDPALRITLDDNIFYRTEDLSLCSPAYGIPILPPDKVLMEIKTAGAIPLWLTSVLTRHHIFKTSFSKYGNAYTDIIQHHEKGVTNHARNTLSRNF